jgi:uncharacterized protein (TIGR02145 family)
MIKTIEYLKELWITGYIPTQADYVDLFDTLGEGVLNYRDEYDASVNLYPDSGGSGTDGLILKANIWIVSVGGIIDGNTVIPGQLLFAKIDDPGQTSANWAISAVGGEGGEETDPIFTEWLDDTPPAYPEDIPDISGLLDETAHDLLDHTGLLGVPTVATNIKHGRLYNFPIVENANFPIVGFHVPTQTEFETLITYLGGEEVAGGKLKEKGFVYWNDPNTGATNESGLYVRGSGYRKDSDGSFLQMGQYCHFWSSEDADGEEAYSLIAGSYLDTIADASDSEVYATGLPVRLLADTPANYNTGDLVPDEDGNIYTVVIIGMQAWLAQNFACTHLNNGTPIPNITDDTEWSEDESGAYCDYDNDVSNVFILPTFDELDKKADLAGAEFTGEVKFNKAVETVAKAVIFSGSLTINFSDSNIQYISITGDTSITLSNLREGVAMIILTNDATPGRAVIIDSTFGTKTDNSAIRSTAANKVNIYTILKYGSTIKYTIETSS